MLPDFVWAFGEQSASIRQAKRACEDIELRELLSKHAQSSISPSKVAKLVKSWQNLQPTRNGTFGERLVAYPA